MMELDAIQKEISSAIVGKAMAELSRAGEALQVWFGKEMQVTFSENRKGMRREHVLRLPFPFRISQGDTILLGNLDMHVPRAGIDKTDFSYESFENSALNAMIECFNQTHVPLIAKEIEVDSTGSLRIQFDKGIILEAFVNGCLRTIDFWQFGSYAPNGVRWLSVFGE